jgi:rSAM/selenodomain-associated transferase 2
VVIPALDEAANVAAAIASVRDDAHEVLVVDGGSSDDTIDRARRAGAQVLLSERGRGVQLAAGASAAGGAWLCFLHADTTLAPGWADAVRAQPPRVVGGAFRLAITARGGGYRLVEAMVAWRCRLLRLPFGDQAIFVRRLAYAASGGFAPLPLFEDVDLVRRLRRLGPLAFPPQQARTSARRWQRHGLLRTTLVNWGLLLAWQFGVPGSRLARIYTPRGEPGTREQRSPPR